MNKEEFIYECKKINIIIDDKIIDKLEKYIKLLIIWNEKFNLTTIIEEKDIQAEFKNGILKIDIPKKEETKKLPEARQIEIK